MHRHISLLPQTFFHTDDHSISGRGPCAMQQVPTGPSFHMPQSAEANPNPLPSPSPPPPPIRFVNKFVCKVQEPFKDPQGYTGLNWIIQPHLPVLTAPTMLSPLCLVTYDIHSFQRLVWDIFRALILPSPPPPRCPHPRQVALAPAASARLFLELNVVLSLTVWPFPSSLLSAQLSSQGNLASREFLLWLSANEPD